MSQPNYMDTSLVVWIQTFSHEKISFYDLIDGYFLNEVFIQIDKNSNIEGAVSKIETSNDRLHNWEMLINKIQFYYQDVLQQYLMMKPPDVCLICYQSQSEQAKVNINSVLLQMLGCAVQCEDKQIFIGVIQGLPTSVQHDIMEAIQQITDPTKSILITNTPLKSIEKSSLFLYSHIHNLLQQRHSLVQDNRNLQQLLNNLTSLDEKFGSSQKNKGIQRISTLNLEMSSLLEQANYKATLRKLKQEIMYKGDLISELEDQVDFLTKQNHKLNNINNDLATETRQIKYYRDEIDVLKEKVLESQKKEEELEKLRKKEGDLEEMKDLVSEVKKENIMLLENKKILEDQLAHFKFQLQFAFDNEMQLIKLKKKFDEVLKEQEVDKNKVKQLTIKMEEYEKDLEFTRSSHGIHNLSTSSSCSLQDSFISNNGQQGSLADQLLQANQSQIIYLENRVQLLEGELARNNCSSSFSQQFLQLFNSEFSSSDDDDEEEEEEEEEIKRDNLKNNGTYKKSNGITKCDFEEEAEQEDVETKTNEENEVFKKREMEKKVLRSLRRMKKEKLRVEEELITINRDFSKLTEESSSLHIQIKQLTFNCQTLQSKNNNLSSKEKELEVNVDSLNNKIQINDKKIKFLEDEERWKEEKLEALEREKVEFERDMDKIKQQLKEKINFIEQINQSNENLKTQIQNLKRLEEEVVKFEERAGRLEAEVKETKQNNYNDKQAIHSLREELVGEKMRLKERDEEIQRLTRLMHENQSKYNNLLKEKEDIFKNSQNLTPENKKLKQEVESLKVKLEETLERMESFKKEESLKDRSMVVTQRYGVSLSASQEIQKLRDQKNRMQIDNTKLEEKKLILEEEIKKLKISINEKDENEKTKEKDEKINLLKEELGTSEKRTSCLEIELASTQLINSSLNADLAHLQMELVSFQQTTQTLESEKLSLETNCRALQKLLDKLGVEHEALQDEFVEVKEVLKHLRQEHKITLDKFNNQEFLIKRLDKKKENEEIREDEEQGKNKKRGKNGFEGEEENEEIVKIKKENFTLQNQVSCLEKEKKNFSNSIKKQKYEMIRLSERAEQLQQLLGQQLSFQEKQDKEVTRLRRFEQLYNRVEDENLMLNDQLRRSGWKGSLRRGSMDISPSPSPTLSPFPSSSHNNSQHHMSSSSFNIKNKITKLTGSHKKDDISMDIHTKKIDEKKPHNLFRKAQSFNEKKKIISQEREEKEEDEEETITLNQFLTECNQSPRSRRKLLVMKQVDLDEEEGGFAQKGHNLDPKPPVVFNSNLSLNNLYKPEPSPSEPQVFFGNGERVKGREDLPLNNLISEKLLLVENSTSIFKQKLKKNKQNLATEDSSSAGSSSGFGEVRGPVLGRHFKTLPSSPKKRSFKKQDSPKLTKTTTENNSISSNSKLFSLASKVNPVPPPKPEKLNSEPKGQIEILETPPKPGFKFSRFLRSSSAGAQKTELTENEDFLKNISQKQKSSIQQSSPSSSRGNIFRSPFFQGDSKEVKVCRVRPATASTPLETPNSPSPPQNSPHPKYRFGISGRRGSTKEPNLM